MLLIYMYHDGLSRESLHDMLIFVYRVDCLTAIDLPA